MKTEANEVPCALVRSPLAGHTRRHRHGVSSDLRRGHRSGALFLASEPRITYIDRAIIRAYYQKLETVPRVCRWDDGAQSTAREPVHIDETLPLAMPVSRLPAELERKLSALGPHYERLIVDDDIVLVEIVTGLVTDVLQSYRQAI